VDLDARGRRLRAACHGIRWLRGFGEMSGRRSALLISIYRCLGSLSAGPAGSRGSHHRDLCLFRTALHNLQPQLVTSRMKEEFLSICSCGIRLVARVRCKSSSSSECHISNSQVT
jgi:hypothetical protein